jgi:ergothioneine biosynthesis protein EgtB
MLSRPGVGEILVYRDHVDAAMLAMLDAQLSPEVAALIELGLQHEQQHQELILTDVKHLLSRNPLKPAYSKQWPLTAIRAREPRWISFAGGLHEIGHAGDGCFCFDNETPRHRVWLEPFRIASHPVTNGAFIDFIEDGGYRRPELWLAAGWEAVSARGWQAPLYWERRDAYWYAFTLHGEVPVDRNAPVCHVSFFEAEAFARWAGARLPGEAEWELAARDLPRDGNFVDSGALHPLALREAPEGALAQAFGDVWEWTRSDYAPYPGFKAATGAVGEYNGKFMSGQYVLRGGSCVTPATHIRATYRNFFPPDVRWQFSGLRLARDA